MASGEGSAFNLHNPLVKTNRSLFRKTTDEWRAICKCRNWSFVNGGLGDEQRVLTMSWEHWDRLMASVPIMEVGDDVENTGRRWAFEKRNPSTWTCVLLVSAYTSRGRVVFRRSYSEEYFMNVGENANACYSYNLDKTHSLAELNKRWTGNSDPENPEFTYEDGGMYQKFFEELLAVLKRPENAALDASDLRIQLVLNFVPDPVGAHWLVALAEHLRVNRMTVRFVRLEQTWPWSRFYSEATLEATYVLTRCERLVMEQVDLCGWVYVCALDRGMEEFTDGRWREQYLHVTAEENEMLKCIQKQCKRFKCKD